jgi:toxin ParE1/3/4
MSVVWTQTATDQLSAIRDYLALSSPAYAQALAGRIVSRSESLDGQPLLGAEVAEYDNPDIREVFEHPYRILYRVSGSDVQILAVVHSARQLPQTPPS